MSCDFYSAMADNLDRLNAQVFREHLHTRFKVHLGTPDTLVLELKEVNDRSTSPQIEAFSVLFRGPATPRLEQRIHSLQHDQLGEFQLFLTAVSGDQEGINYESVFNRLRDFKPPKP